MPGSVAHTYNPIIREAGTGGLPPVASLSYRVRSCLIQNKTFYVYLLTVIFIYCYKIATYHKRARGNKWVHGCRGFEYFLLTLWPLCFFQREVSMFHVTSILTIVLLEMKRDRPNSHGRLLQDARVLYLGLYLIVKCVNHSLGISKAQKKHIHHTNFEKALKTVEDCLVI